MRWTIRITTHQLTLGYSQGGILRKDDLFKVVSNPGADKREKGILGQIIHRISLILIRQIPFFLRIRIANDTGGAGLTISCLHREG